MRLPSFTSRRLVQAFNRAGFEIDRQSGSHVVLRHPPARRAVIPFHNRKLKRGTLLGIIKQAGYAVEEFIELI